ncbi:MAG: PHP domain-containing protein [candidate division Zixibacteria bacterium]|nr:PHP domain-containing protein [candidate division Zixibacteria bacterium]
MKIDLHTHTEHSFNSKIDIRSLLSRAEGRGLDAIAICDHDTMSAVGIARKLSTRIIVIPGMEIRSDRGTHIIGLFLQDEIIARDIFKIIDEIHFQEGLVLIPHPCRPDTGLIYNCENKGLYDRDELSKIILEADLIELFDLRSSEQELYKTGKFVEFFPGLPQIASSNAHSADEIGKAYIELEDVKADSLGEIKSALLHSPRLLRYEVYCADGIQPDALPAGPTRSKRLLIKTGRLIPSPLRKSIQTIYRKSAGKLARRRERENSKREY